MNPKVTSNKSPVISVVMATYNGARFIAEAIQSVLDQTYKDFEFIIVDDGSIDHTAQIIHSFDDHRIRYIKKESNSGIADSLNIGIAKAQGEFIARMDDDDVSLPKRFEKQMEVFEKSPELIFCGTNAQNNLGKPNATPEFHEDILLRLFFFRNPIFHPTALIRRRVLLEHKYNLEMVPAEDHDLWSRLLFEGQFYQLQQPYLYVRLHKTSTTASRRHEQLQHNITISKFIHHKIGFKRDANHEICISIFASHDYTISGKMLVQLKVWLKNLKQCNKKNKTFIETKFNKVANACWERYLISYFINNTKQKKISAFLRLGFKDKFYIIKHYIKVIKLK